MNSMTLIRKCAVALILQARGHFFYRMIMLREEFASAQERYFVQEEEVRGTIPDAVFKEYRHEVAPKCFVISIQFGARTVFPTFTLTSSTNTK
jgi:hypothetical protein